MKAARLAPVEMSARSERRAATANAAPRARRAAPDARDRGIVFDPASRPDLGAATLTIAVDELEPPALAWSCTTGDAIGDLTGRRDLGSHPSIGKITSDPAREVDFSAYVGGARRSAGLRRGGMGWVMHLATLVELLEREQPGIGERASTRGALAQLYAEALAPKPASSLPTPAHCREDIAAVGARRR